MPPVVWIGSLIAWMIVAVGVRRGDLGQVLGHRLAR